MRPFIMSRSRIAPSAVVTCLLLAAAAFAPDASAASAPKPSAAAVLLRVAGDKASETGRFVPFADIEYGRSLAAGDMDGDGKADIIMGAPAGAFPMVKIFREDGSLLKEFLAYQPEMKEGVTVAVGDLTGDGKSEIVTASGPGVPTHVVIYDATGAMKVIAGGFFPFGKDFKGGANLAVADLDGDGKGEILTGSGQGESGPRVGVWAADGTPKGEFFPFHGSAKIGSMNIAAGDLDGDGKAEIVAAMADFGSGMARVFDGVRLAPRGEFTAIGNGFFGGLNLAVADVDDNGTNDILVGTSGGGQEQINVFDAYGTPLLRTDGFDKSYKGGVLVASAVFPSGRRIVALPTRRAGEVPGRPDLAKYIYVDVSEQRLRSYEYGKLVRTFLVSTGRYETPTPIGNFNILAKPLLVHYRMVDAPTKTLLYDLGIIKWNLRFFPSYYIHNAPWHNNFGRRMSHGCVNVNKTNAEWIYNWAEVGTPVSVVN